MKYWAIVLHFYQPPTQEDEITWNILTFCYLPLLRMLDSKSNFGITINITECLKDQLKKLEAKEFFDLIDKLVESGKVELLASAKYHPILPLVPKEALNRHIYGDSKARCFFPPELAINSEVLNALNFSLVLIDESSLSIKAPLVQYKNKHLLVNDRKICDLLRAYQGNLKLDQIIDLLKPGLNITVNDAELFGHHYSERLEVLSKLLDSTEIRFLTVSRADERFGRDIPLANDIKPSTWQNCQEFNLWSKNDLQKKYMKLLEKNLEDDQAFSSCFLYWLSNWPWWHPGFVQKGIDSMKKSEETEAFLKDMWDYHCSGQVERNYAAFDKKVTDLL